MANFVLYIIKSKLKSFISHIIKLVLVALAGMFMLASAACSTGIESTKTIKMNKDDIRQMAKTDEQIFASQIKGELLKDWKPGKEFIAMSDRTLYVFDPVSSVSEVDGSMQGDTLQFVGVQSRLNPDLKEECVILFSDGDQLYHYSTGKLMASAMDDIDSSKLPLLSDLDLILAWKEKLIGNRLWTKSNLWYDKDNHRKDGLKFAEVKVLDIVPSTDEFPLNVKISHNGEISYIHMNYTSDKADSRNFAAVFFLSDPKSKYPQISEDNWKLIKSGRVGLGMTKDECRLALGNPDEVQSGHSTSEALDIWQYSNGAYLFFSDGLLTRFRQ